MSLCFDSITVVSMASLFFGAVIHHDHRWRLSQGPLSKDVAEARRRLAASPVGPVTL